MKHNVRRQRKAAVEFAKATAKRPKIAGEALHKTIANPEVVEARFKILDVENLLEGDARLTLLPKDNELIKHLVSADSIQGHTKFTRYIRLGTAVWFLSRERTIRCMKSVFRMWRQTITVVYPKASILLLSTNIRV